MFFVKFLHAPLISKHSKERYKVIHPLYKNHCLHLNYHRSFVEATLVQEHVDSYCKYNEYHFVLWHSEGKRIPPHIVEYLVLRTQEIWPNDATVNAMFTDSLRLFAYLTIFYEYKTFDRYDPRNVKHWPEIVKRATGAELGYRGRRHDAADVWYFKINRINIDEIETYSIDSTSARTITRELIRTVEILADDLATRVLNELAKNVDAEPWAVMDDLAMPYYLL